MFSKLSALEKIANKAEALIDKIDALLPAPPTNNWQAIAYKWQKRDVGIFGTQYALIPIASTHIIHLDDLHDIDEQKSRLVANTKQFIAGQSANNVLLTGARGTGKSSLVKALLTTFAKKGLRIIEVDRADLIHLPEIAALVASRSEKFIIFADDLSFDAHDSAYKALKSVLDGGIAAPAQNILVYATSNRRHLMPESMTENAAARHTEDGEIHPGETTEEKISLSERFGLWLSFYPFDQDQYLAIARHWVTTLAPKTKKINDAHFRQAALLWALERGGRSGRIAYQFARDYAGRTPARIVAVNVKKVSTKPRNRKPSSTLKKGS